MGTQGNGLDSTATRAADHGRPGHGRRLVFAGSLDRRISAYDAATGDRLWALRLSEVPNAPPISYAVDGQQAESETGCEDILPRARSPSLPNLNYPAGVKMPPGHPTVI